ncbi:MAG: ABC transporter permease [Candidatus Coatesbacteria bacterium]|nr:MAG: ABC transporter permease [Candidatus Coatesbacteria bacterium]
MPGVKIPYFKIAWRNLWRNKRRSVLTIAAVALCSWLLLWMMYFAYGGHDNWLENYVRILTGHVQVHALGFADDMSVMKRIRDPEPVYSVIESARYVRAYSPRIKTYALAAAHGNSAGAFILAFDPARERTVSNMHKSLKEGNYLTPGRDDEVVLAFALAENLGVGIGDEVAIMVQAADGSMGADKYTVVGLCDPGISTMNNTLMMMNLAAAQELLAYGPAVNEIVVMVDDPNHVNRTDSEIERGLDPDEYEVLTWAEAAPELEQLIAWDWASFVLTIMVFGVVAALGVMNTVLMSVFERVREFGILMAMGMRPRQLARLVMLENVMMTLVAIAIGFAIGFVNAWVNSWYGLDLSVFNMGESLADWGMANTVMFAKINLRGFLISFALIFGMSTSAAVYPAWKTARMKPVDALKFR